MSEKSFSIAEIKELLSAVKENQISELAIKQDDFSIKIKGIHPEVVNITTSPMPLQQPVIAAAESAGYHEVIADTHLSNGDIVTAPIVGTFYQSPSPDKAVYVKVGDRVTTGDVLFIIESMKLMNEVTSELDGIVTEIHVTDGQAVEYGQPILTIE